MNRINLYVRDCDLLPNNLLFDEERGRFDVSDAEVLRVGQVGDAQRGHRIAGARLRVAEMGPEKEHNKVYDKDPKTLCENNTNPALACG